MTYNYIVNDENNGKRLDIYIQSIFSNLTRSHIKKLIEDGCVQYNNKTVKCGEKIKFGANINVTIEEPKPLSVEAENIKLDIVYEDDDLAVINKPSGMVVHPANGNTNGTLVNALLFNLKNLSGINGIIRPGIVHRLDKDTSGLLIVAKNDISHVNLAKQIETKKCHRYYLALCNGNFKDDVGIIQTGYGRSPKNRKQMAVFDLGEGKKAITEYRVIERFGNYTLVEYKLQTGRTHQIRVHSKYIGHSIVGDLTYGVKNKEFKTNGQLLHAYKIEFEQPTTKKWLTFETKLPEEFEKILNILKSKKKTN